MAATITPTTALAIEAIHDLMLPAALGEGDSRLPRWAHDTLTRLILSARQAETPEVGMTALLHSVFFLGVAAERNSWPREYEAVQP